MTETRGELRARRRAQRREEFWADRASAATTPAEHTTVAYDWLLARIRDLPDDEQPAAWDALTEHLDAFTPPGNLHANFARPGSEFRRPMRTAATRPRPRARDTRSIEGTPA